MARLTCFKAYDIRGRVPDELDATTAYRIGRAYALEINPTGPVAIGRDVRPTSESLADRLTEGLNDAGVDTVSIGCCGTEMVYYSAALPGMGGGIMVTASHNPIDYNGMKLVRNDAIPITDETGLDGIERRTREVDLGRPAPIKGRTAVDDVSGDYVRKILSFVRKAQFKPLKIVANPGNGCAGPFFEMLASHLPFDIVKLNFDPDATFPNGIPNPLLPENQPATSNAVKQNDCDLGIAWDGDFDRCFFFDETGNFVDGYYIVGLLAEQLLKDHPGDKIIHDPRMTWNTVEVVQQAGGKPVVSRTGHAYMKQAMREEDAVYGGEMSAHHYFRDFSYCDSGMIPWLLVTALMTDSGKKLSQLVAERKARYPGSGEINSHVNDPQKTVEAVEKHFAAEATLVERIDGLSMEFNRIWRFNLRSSQTEPILRLNVESFRNPELVQEKTKEILKLIEAIG